MSSLLVSPSTPTMWEIFILCAAEVYNERLVSNAPMKFEDFFPNDFTVEGIYFNLNNEEVQRLSERIWPETIIIEDVNARITTKKRLKLTWPRLFEISTGLLSMLSRRAIDPSCLLKLFEKSPVTQRDAKKFKANIIRLSDPMVPIRY